MEGLVEHRLPELDENASVQSKIEFLYVQPFRFCSSSHSYTLGFAYVSVQAS